MHRLSGLRHALGFTENEIRVILFLSVTLLVGTGIRWLRPGTSAGPPSYDYARSDSEFAARSAASEFPLSTDTPGLSPAPVLPLTPQCIDINSATVAELDRLPGIGPAYAERIVLDREANGPFARVDDLERVRGIGPKTLEKIRPFVTARPPH